MEYNPNRQFLLYKSDKGDVKVDVLLQNETIWMPQNKIAELFEVKCPAITKQYFRKWRTRRKSGLFHFGTNHSTRCYC